MQLFWEAVVAALALAAATFLMAGCQSAAPEDSSVTLAAETAQEATEAEDDPAASQTEEEMFVSGSNHVTTFQFRGAQGDCYPTADDLTVRGYQCFVVDYRLSRDLGALDLARATRFVRAHWEEYGLPHADAIAVMGYSAGGIAAGQMLLDWDGTTSPALFDAAYEPDELDAVSADAAADGMIYSFYGRLSVASKDVAQLRAGNLPPTYFAFGTRDPFVSEFEANIAALEAAGVEVEGVVLQGWPHGFGAYGGWIDGYDAFLRRAFDAARND